MSFVIDPNIGELTSRDIFTSVFPYTNNYEFYYTRNFEVLPQFFYNLIWLCSELDTGMWKYGHRSAYPEIFQGHLSVGACGATFPF